MPYPLVFELSIIVGVPNVIVEPLTEPTQTVP